MINRKVNELIDEKIMGINRSESKNDVLPNYYDSIEDAMKVANK